MEREDPLVSVIIPHYNRGRALELCLRALAEQTYAPIEVIVVDDGSTDGSPEIAVSAGATVLRTATNSGQSAARNLGAEHAGGRILFFLDSDIALEPDAVENAVATLRANPALGAVCGILLPESLVCRSLAARYRALQTYHWWMPTGRPTRELHAALLAVPAEVFREVGPFRPDLVDTEAADYRSRVVQRYQVQITADIKGTHDHDATLRTVLRKVFRRARASALEWRRGELPGDSWSRAFSGGLLLGGVLAAPLPVMVGPVGAAVPLVLVATAIGFDGGTYRRGFAHRGPLFGLYFVAVHLLVTLVGVTGTGTGVIERILRRPHRAAPARSIMSESQTHRSVSAD